MDTGDDGDGGSGSQSGGTGDIMHRKRRRRKHKRLPRTVVNPDENFYFYWMFLVTGCVLYNLWTLIVRQSFPELQDMYNRFWIATDIFTDLVFVLDVAVQFRTGYLEQGLMVYDSRKLAGHYMKSRSFLLDLAALLPLDLIQLNIGVNPMLRFPRFLKVYRAYDYYYMVESRTIYPNFWRVVNLIHILLILAHWFGCFYYLLSEAEKFQGDWVYPYRPGEYATLSRKYLGSLYWSTLTLTTIGDLPTPESNADKKSTDGLQTLPRRGHKSRILQFHSNRGFVFTITSYLIGVFIFATIVGQVGNVITNRNANRLEFERLLDGAKTYMRHHKVPGGMKRRVLRWYDYSWSRGRIQGGGDINTALGLLPDKLKTELALHVNLSVLKKVTIFQECQPEFLHDLVLKMKAYIFTPGDLICRKGEVAREMFIIADGILEVKSETGRVLTTMKAGDFFGEIGILNLDGLNRRTADVRSVGYSELFSLSREDVLAAMKDYPEAQEILQTLGRKRLMEARSMNRQSKNMGKKRWKKRARYEVPPNTELESGQSRDGNGSDNNKNATSPGSSENFDNKTGKRIVDKLRCEGVKGWKSVLRKSRRGTRSKEEYMELQPLTACQRRDRYHTREGKGVLSRMPRVVSDDTSQEDEPYSSQQDTRIGAGLPLLQRLKLLKEKQDKETVEKNKKVLKVHAEKKEEAHEVIGAGLPLLQRLHLLKQKEDAERDAKTVRTTATETAQVLASTVRTQMNSPPLSLRSDKSKDKSKEEELPLKPIILNRPSSSKNPKDTSTGKNGVVSWKEDCEKEIKSRSNSIDLDAIEKNQNTMDKPCEQDLKSEVVKPKSSLKFHTLLKQAGLSVKPETHDLISHPSPEPKHKSSPLKGSEISSPKDQSPKTSFSEYSMNSQVTKLQERITPDASKPVYDLLPSELDGDINKLSGEKKLKSVTSNNESMSHISQLKENAVYETVAQNTKSAQNSVSKDNKFKISSQSPSIKDSFLIDIETSSDDQRSLLCRKKSFRKTQASLDFSAKNKIYRSIEDLSPECSNLPFIKQLRILNERQKFSDLQDKAFLRSSSLDSGNDSENQIHEATNLTRSHSEAIAIEVVLRNQDLRAESKTAQNFQMVQTTPSLLLSPEGTLISPESNETVERRQLKSILKKLSSTSLTNSNASLNPSEGQTILSSSPSDLKKLMRAQTVEGYAARHSKLTKSVTFNRDTLQSPPSGSNNQGSSQVFQYSKVSLSLDAPGCDRAVCRSPTSLSTLLRSEEHQIKNECLDKSVASNGSECQRTDQIDSHLFVLPSLPVVTSQSSMSFPTGTVSTTVSEISVSRTENCAQLTAPQETKDFPFKSYEAPRRPQGNLIERPQAKQKNFFRPGSILLPTHASQEEEFFGGILNGIKHIIQNHLEEIQNKFQTRFHDLEMEVKKRDDIIAQLQERIQELENTEGEDNSDVESIDVPFMRGDSVDTIVGSSRWGSEAVATTSIDMGSESGSASEEEDKFTTASNNWEVQMLAQELDRRESLTRSQDLFLQGELIRRRQSVIHDSGQDYSQPLRKKNSNEEIPGVEVGRQRRPPLLSVRSLEESSSRVGLSSPQRRSLSISSLHSTISSGIFRGLGTLVRGNITQTSSDAVPTISRSCPSSDPPSKLPDL